MKVLVVAPRFPAINQPWMDTYLEHLLAQNIDCSISSNNMHPDKYQGKVDRLRLRERVVFLAYNKLSLLASTPFVFCQSPWRFFNGNFAHLSLGARLMLILNAAAFRRQRSKTNNVCLIHSHEEIAGYIHLALAQVLKVPMVLTFHGLPPVGVGQLSQSKRYTLYREAKAVIVNTQFAKRQVHSLGCAEEKIVILPQGLPVNDFVFSPAPIPTHKEPLRLLTVGRFHRDKGHGYALVAIKRLINAGVSVHYSIVGVGEGLVRLQYLVKCLELDKHVEFISGLSDVALKELYHQNHMFILPSISTSNSVHIETQGVVLQEAQASGCIPIAAKTGGIPECLNHGEDSMLVKPQSGKAIAEAVIELLEKRDIWPQIQKNGRKNVEENFSADCIGKKMAALLKSFV